MFENTNNFLTKILGIIFISTSIYRIGIEEQRKEELKIFGLPDGFDYFIIIFEFVIGLLLLFSTKYNILSLKVLFIFLLTACVIIIIKNYEKLWNEKNSVFTFQNTPMSLVLHITYLIIITSLVI